jgi:integrase
MAFIFAADEYLDLVKRSMAKETYRQKVAAYNGFLAMFPRVAINEVTASMVIDYLKTLKTNDQYNRHRKELSALFEYTKNILEAIPNNPVLKISKLPHTPERKIIPTEKQVLSILMMCDLQSDERDLLLCVLLTVARIDEILRLRWEDVNFERKTVTKFTKKRKGAVYEPIVVPMNVDLYNVLWKMWEKRVQEVWVFYNEKTGSRYQHRPKFMNGLCKRAGIDPPFGFHALRHYMSSMMADSQKMSTSFFSIPLPLTTDFMNLLNPENLYMKVFGKPKH